MSNVSDGGGDALDAQIDTSSEVEKENARSEAERVVAGAQAKVDKQRAHLADAETALKNAQAALAALDK